ncbi:granzyme K isoform X1 [Phocoena sinus]|uniref:granzyme K isoform X1 n=1 Tax=Phocoena sinus TaxID=42100 RepID=UPI0013C43331|nr:granzyme K isoform X1 [Phocoena sinus]
MTKFSSFFLCFLIAGTYMTPECFNMEIIGGREASPHSRPFMASVQYGGNHICGGVLIHPQWVLTAAHCHSRFAKGQSSRVVLGAHSLSKNEASKQTFEIKRFIRFPGFTSDPKSNDIMLVELHTAAKLNKHVQLLHPRAKDDIKAGTKCQVIGWGATDLEFLRPSDTLREVTVTVISRKVCNSPSYYNHHPIITKNMVCAGDARGQKDSCQVRTPHSNRHFRLLSYSQAPPAHLHRGGEAWRTSHHNSKKGDSGGPMICKGAFHALVSGGRKCGDAKKPGIYILLTWKYQAWIKSILAPSHAN